MGNHSSSERRNGNHTPKLLKSASCPGLTDTDIHPQNLPKSTSVRPLPATTEEAGGVEESDELLKQTPRLYSAAPSNNSGNSSVPSHASSNEAGDVTVASNRKEETSIVAYKHQWSLPDSVILKIFDSLTKREVLPFAFVCQQFRHLIYYKMIIPELQSMDSIEEYHRLYSSWYSQHRKTLNFAAPSAIPITNMADKRRLIFFLIFQSAICNPQSLSLSQPEYVEQKKRQMINEFQQTFTDMQMVEVHRFYYNKARRVEWLSCVVASQFTTLQMVDLSGSAIGDTEVQCLLDGFNARRYVSPLHTLNFTGNRRVTSCHMPELFQCIGDVLVNLRSLYLDYTSVCNDTCEEIYTFYSDNRFSHRRSRKYTRDDSHNFKLRKVVRRKAKETQKNVNSNNHSNSSEDDNKNASDAGDEASEMLHNNNNNNNNNSNQPKTYNKHKSGVTRLKKISLECTHIDMEGVNRLNDIFANAMVRESDHITLYLRPRIYDEDDEAIQRKCDKRIHFY